MGLLGESWDDPKTAAILGLAGGLLGGNPGAGIQNALQGAQRQALINRDISRQEKADRYTDEKHAMEIAALKRAALTDAALGQAIFGDQYASIVSGQPPASPASVALSDGAKVGSVGPTVSNAARMDAQPPRQGMFASLDQNAVKADYLLNKGKNLSEWLFKRNTPDMQVSNGYAYDKNNLAPGFLPGVSTSANGQTTVTTPDGHGGIRVQAPTGALETYSAYRSADENAKARTDLVQVPMANGQVRYMPRSEAIAATSGNAGAPRAYPTMGNANITDEVRGLIEADAARNGITNPTIRMNTAVPGQTLSLAGSQIGVAPSEAEKTAAVRTASANADRASANTDKASQFQTFKQQLGLAKNYLREGPTASTIGATVDNVLGLGGVSTKGANLAAQLDVLSGWMMQNIPKAPGAQSDTELRDYKDAAGKVGNRTLPVAQRLAALNTVETIVGQWEARMSNGDSAPQPAAIPLPSNPSASNLTKGQIYETPKGRGRWNGMVFEKVD